MFNVVGFAAVVAYVYVAVLAGRASYKAGHSWGRVVVDAATWPVMMWKTIEDLYRAR